MKWPGRVRRLLRVVSLLGLGASLAGIEPGWPALLPPVPDFIFARGRLEARTVAPVGSLTYAWTFQDGSPATSTLQNPTVVFASPGAKAVTLKVCNAAGCSSVTKTVTVLNPAPSIQATSLAPNPERIGATLTATATALGKPPLTYRWTGPTGVVVSGNPALLPTTGWPSGPVSVRLDVSNASGRATNWASVLLLAKLITNFAAVCPPSGCVFPIGTTVSFTLTTTSTPVWYEYDWDGNGTWDESNFAPIRSHTYRTAGTFYPVVQVFSDTAIDSFRVVVPIHVGSSGASGGSFYTLGPCRLVDTRSPVGPLGGPSLASGSTRRFNLAGTCGVPASAVALSLNVTIVNPTALGYLSLYSASLPSRPLASTLNYAPGRTRANNAVLGVSSDGLAGLDAYLSAGSADLVLDVNGYFQ